MAENYNIDAHYTNNPKVEKQKHIVTNVPEKLPTVHLYNDYDAKKRFEKINQDVYISSEKEKEKPSREFMKICAISLVAGLGILGLKKFFTKS